MVLGSFVFLLFFGCLGPVTPSGGNTTNATGAQLKKFGSMDELKSFLSSKTISGGYGYYDGGIMPAMRTLSSSSAPTAAESGNSKASDYSQTNIQVAGVDEADFVKNDGRYLYVLSGKNLVIVDAYPAENATILSKTDVGNPTEIYVNADDLVVFASDGYSNTTILQYDISDRSNPVLKKNLSVEGYYFDSRMIDDFVYVLVNKPIYYYYDYYGGGASSGSSGGSTDGTDDVGIAPPSIRCSSGSKCVSPSNSSAMPDIYYFDEPAYSYEFTTVLSIDLSSDSSAPTSKIFLMGTSQELYVSEENIYVTYQKIPDYVILRSNPLVEVASLIAPMPSIEYKEETAIHRIAIKDGTVEYQASGSVPGYILNQFSMDEYNGYFRIATTTGQVWGSGATASKNNVYTLDSSLNITGKLEDLAPGETIYSARFMGDRAYLVTFRKVDPLFVINMTDPTNLTLLGKLKIPGYSDYLHPYDETHLIGFGKDAVPSETGDFSWYQGVKISLFDVTDVSKPKEIANYTIGDRGTDSYALYDHKAFLFDQKKGILVVPILLAEIDQSQYPSGTSATAYGDYVYQGAYVFNISVDDGISLRGRVTHVDDNSTFMKSGYYYYGDGFSVKRSLYMDDVLYTISDAKVKMNNLTDMQELNSIKLPYEQKSYPYYYYE